MSSYFCSVIAQEAGLLTLIYSGPIWDNGWFKYHGCENGKCLDFYKPENQNSGNDVPESDDTWRQNGLSVRSFEQPQRDINAAPFVAAAIGQMWGMFQFGMKYSESKNRMLGSSVGDTDGGKQQTATGWCAAW